MLLHMKSINWFNDKVLRSTNFVHMFCILEREKFIFKDRSLKKTLTVQKVLVSNDSMKQHYLYGPYTYLTNSHIIHQNYQMHILNVFINCLVHNLLH